jgi:polar amino acid transport system substrate-binding protein
MGFHPAIFACYTGSMRPFHVALTALLAALSGSVPAMDCPPVTRVGLSDLGYSSFQVDGKSHGVSVDIIAELGKRTGCKFELLWFPRGRLFAEFDAGKVDITMGSVQTPQRDAMGRHIPYSYTQFELVLAKQLGKFSSLADFVDHSKARLNLVRGIAYAPETAAQVERLTQAGRVELVNDFEVVFKKMALNRTDGTIAPSIIYTLHLRRQGITDVVASPIPEAPRQVIGMYVSKKSVPLDTRNAFATAVRGMLEDGSMPARYAAYLEPPAVKVLFKDGVRDVLDAYRAE